MRKTSYHIFGIAQSIDLRGAFPTTPIVLVDNRREFPPVKNKAETGVSTSFYSIQRIKMFLLILVISCCIYVYIYMYKPDQIDINIGLPENQHNSSWNIVIAL